jgi:uncharacterized protein (DUF302 family)
MTPEGADAADGIVTKASRHTVEKTVRRLTQLITDKGLTLFGVIDHSGEAKKAGLKMPDTKLVIFGSPAAGTPVMLAAPLAGLDLPLKALVWADTEGGVWVSYNSPGYLAARHHLSDDLRARLEGIDPITDAAVAPDE